MSTPNTIIWTECFVFFNMNLSHKLTLKNSGLRIDVFSRKCQGVQLAVSKFLEEWIVLQCCFQNRQCLTDSRLLHRRQNLKQIKRMREIITQKWRHFTHGSLYIIMKQNKEKSLSTLGFTCTIFRQDYFSFFFSWIAEIHKTKHLQMNESLKTSRNINHRLFNKTI